MKWSADQGLPDRVQRRLERPLPGAVAQGKFAPELSYGRHGLPPFHDARHAAVMILLYVEQGEWRLPLTIRADTLTRHAGQISLPGGEIDPGETVEQAALREAFEELQVDTGAIDVLGRLSPLYVFASNYQITPCVAAARGRPQIVANPAEVAGLLEPTLDELLEPKRRGMHLIDRRGIRFRAPHIEIQGRRVWGATSMILAEFLQVVAETD